MNIANLKIGTRLGIAFAFILTLLIVVAFVGILNMSKMDTGTHELVHVAFVKTKLSYDALDNVRGSMSRVFEMVGMTDDQEIGRVRERLQSNTTKFDDALNKLEPLMSTPEGKELFLKIKETHIGYINSVAKVLGLVSASKHDEASKLAYGETYAALHAFADTLRAMADLQQKHFEQGGEQSEQTYASARNQVTVLSVLAVLLGVFGAVWIARSITVPLVKAVSLAETIASGDLTSQFGVQCEDETGQLMRALQEMNDNLMKIVGEVRVGTETILTASREISQGNLDLSSRTEAQAGALEETASSMEELTSTVKQNADNALQANKLAQNASSVATKGGSVVSNVVDTMGAINTSAKKIVDIISVIDGIAFQTNILALNAAVEAARAGEQGRGFAVVASEVRNLAQRSAAAAKEIKELIGDSVEKVEAGSALVNEAGATMTEVVTSIKLVTDIMAEITAASQEQSQGIDQINQAIVEMDNVTQQNAALVEEAAAAAGSMQEQASNLMEVVNVFKLNNNQVSSSRAAPKKVANTHSHGMQVRGKPNQAFKRPASALIKHTEHKTPVGDDFEEF
ncbi:methyl-accepting chemotaxis protein [Solimicrobium silvestre]|uniref:Methyl-accepting chemotaxis protein (MCP) signaling domain n=1 Tax=Solimicrobium silvestre TaxID=2099400 RepID=A0A2S9GZ55_9BURK|nr:methyl-accepting chemotaxis protein [Solimicrobium silvestre]PRC92987.1 Methyl-accepting chemotaxis protein (MCP) signaling domain [Solimicrobium silvestre]